MKNLYKSIALAVFVLSSLSIYAQVPIYNSLPSAQAVILLDFDGHKVQGTSWNTSGPINCDGSNLELSKITEIYNRIAEDYSPFNVNITTDEAKYNAAPTKQRMRVIFTITSEWYGSAGGVAYIGSFTWGDNTPCFVFTKLLNYNTKYISEAGAHEAGHTLSLRHQASYDALCNKTSDYNYGTGSGDISWAPIMGVGYYKNFTTWYNGANPYGCTYYQPDADIITTNNGFGYRTDDFGETFTAATSQTFSANKFATSAVITNSVDKDMFKFTLDGRKRVTLNATPTSVGAGDAGSNLDIKLDLYNSAQTLVGSYNPELKLSASADTVLDAGTYYLLVDGVGNQYTSEYGSVGSFSITAEQAPLAVLPLRKLELQGAVQGSAHKFNWEIDADEEIVEQILEVSTNGKQFEPAGKVNNSARSFQYTPANGTAFQYRLNVTFDNGKQHYSNVIALKGGKISRPEMYTNIIGSNSIMVTSPSAYSYFITDLSGRTMAKGIIAQGSSTINVHNITNGTYIIQFANGAEQFVDKFVKQ